MRHPRVLVTGFCDWRELGETADLWRCRDNTSGRLLTGEATTSATPNFAGPLVRHLQQCDELAADFALLPVLWGTFYRLSLSGFDALIHLGLGRQAPGLLLLENGAINRRERRDAAGKLPKTPVIEDLGPPSRPLSKAASASLHRLTKDHSVRGYQLQLASPRPENVYLCNETHYLSLQATAKLSHQLGREIRSYFIHLPAVDQAALPQLGAALAGIIRALMSDVSAP